MRQVGDRIGAILSAKKGEVKLLGFGIYAGREVAKPEHGGWANHKLILDDGRVVWGYECWWGSEESVRHQIAGCKIINVTIDGKEIENGQT